MRRVLPAAMLVWAALAAISADARTPDPVTWRGSAIVDQGEGPDTIEVAVVPVAHSSSGERVPWYDAQDYLRRTCMACGLYSWGDSAAYDGDRAGETHYVGYRPLADRVFLLVDLRLRGPTPLAHRLAWRMDDADSTVVTLGDGRVLVAEGPVELPEPHRTLVNHSDGYMVSCAEARMLVGGRTLYRADELAELARHKSWYTSDGENSFAVPLRLSDPPHDFMARVAGVRVQIAGRWVELAAQPR